MSNLKKNSEPLSARYWQPYTQATSHDFITLSRATSGMAFQEMGSRMSYIYPTPVGVWTPDYNSSPFCVLSTTITEFSGPGAEAYAVSQNTYMIPWFHQIQHNAIGVHIQFACDKNFPVIMDVRSKTLVTSVTTVASAQTKEIQTKPLALGSGDWLMRRNLYWGDARMTIMAPEVPTDRTIALVPRVKIPRASAYLSTGDSYYCYIYSVRVWDILIDVPDVGS